MGRWSRQREPIQFPRLQRIQDCNEEEYSDDDDKNDKIVHQVKVLVPRQVWRSNDNPRAYRKLTDAVLSDDDDVDERQAKAWEDEEPFHIEDSLAANANSGFSSKRTVGGWRIRRRVRVLGSAKSKLSSRIMAVTSRGSLSLRRRLRVLLSPLGMLRKVRDAYIRAMMGIADKSNPTWASLIKGI